MSADKRRRARVQGGWSAPQKPKVNSKPTLGANNPAGAGWLGKTVDTPIKEKFVYQNPDEVYMFHIYLIHFLYLYRLGAA